MAKSIKCSLCGRELEYLGGPMDMFPTASVVGSKSALEALEQWRGNVCPGCKLVFCPSCIELGGPTPCPKCGQPTKPAQRVYLKQIGKL
jgi:hypothetical protein